MPRRRPADLPGLPNVVAYCADIYSGGVPEGAQGFETLRKLGIKSIISVDGAAPDVDLAHAAGFHYVHLPVEYGGITDERKFEVTQAIRDLPRPIYVHCHHGKHRSAAATALAMVGLGVMTPEEATARMKVSGTAPAYAGLYQCVAVAKIASAAELDKAKADYPEVWKTSGLVQTMVEVDEIFDRLKLIETAGWKTPVDHPDLIPAAEAGRLADLMRAVKNDRDVSACPPELSDWLQAASDHATALERSLVVAGTDPTVLAAQFAAVGQSCKTCHAKYRD